VPPVARITTLGFFPWAVLVWQFASASAAIDNQSTDRFSLISMSPV
jgi:hypothetical protein